MIAVNVIEGACEMMAKKIGMKENTLTLLYALDDGKAHSQKEICKEWLIPKTTLNTIVKECIENEYIFFDNEARKKEKDIRLTEKGRIYANEMLEKIHGAERRAMEKTFFGESDDFSEKLKDFSLNLENEARSFFDEQ